MITRRHVQQRSGLMTVERPKKATTTISPDMTATGASGCTSVYSRRSNLFALASVLGIAVTFVGISLQIIDFPLAAHADEGSKVLQIQQSSYNYNHPLLMLELAHVANAAAGLSNPQSVVELGRTLSVIAGGFAIFATFLLACEVLPRLAALAATVTVAVVPALTVHARYFKEDIFMLPFLLLALVVLIRMLKAPTRARSIILGGLIGLAASAKYVAIIVLPFRPRLAPARGCFEPGMVEPLDLRGSRYAVDARRNDPDSNSRSPGFHRFWFSPCRRRC